VHLVNDDKAVTRKIFEHSKSGVAHHVNSLGEVSHPELHVEFLIPLLRQRVRHTNQDPKVSLVKKELSQDDAGLNRLAESDLVREKIPLNRVTEYALDYLNLMTMKFDPRRNQSRQALTKFSLFENLAHKGGPLLRRLRRMKATELNHINRVSQRQFRPHKQPRDRNRDKFVTVTVVGLYLDLIGRFYCVPQVQGSLHPAERPSPPIALNKAPGARPRVQCLQFKACEVLLSAIPTRRRLKEFNYRAAIRLRDNLAKTSTRYVCKAWGATNYRFRPLDWGGPAID
jgi:hypothetical protein